ncbi:MAG: 3'-5' exonuclease [Candidatus Pacebacteria bacterium]|nr:3'-5' exonuclease [Candidatus Paceibacterota bacterium]
MYLFFDTETTGLPRNWNAQLEELDNWPRMVQLAWVLCDQNGNKISEKNRIIKPEGFVIPREAAKLHGITTARARKEGIFLEDALIEFKDTIGQADYLVAHNISFDEKIVGAEFLRKDMANALEPKNKICTMEKSTNFCAIESSRGYKWPKLSELYFQLFGLSFEDAHDAAADINATTECFWELKRLGVI